MNIVTGEKLQSLTEISLCTDIDCIKADQIKQLPQNIVKISDFSPQDISKFKKIFIYTDYIHDVMLKYENYLSDNITIVTHNSDCGVDASCVNYLENKKIKKWFCQNKYIDHQKLISLPIGIANRQWPHGNIELLQRIINQQNAKTNLVYKNFEIGTNTYKRNLCHYQTELNGIPMWPKTNNEEYWQMISRSLFTIAPHGNGVDSHRIWECLYLGSIPIVEYHTCFSQFKHLPILFVDNYSILTKEFLEQQYTILRNKNNACNELDLEYWKQNI